MKKGSNLRWLTASMLVRTVAAVWLLCASSTVFAQDAATKRLYLAVIGYELNEVAAKDALAAGANINWKNDAMNGETMLIMAIKGYQDVKSIKFLLDHGADPNIKDDAGLTALEWARRRNIGNNNSGREILKLLENATANKGAANPPATLPGVKAEKPATAPKPGAPAQATPPAQTATTTPAKKPRRTSGPPTAEEVKETIEENFTTIYQNHFFGVKNKVTFAWEGAIAVAQPETRLRPARACYPVKFKVKVTATDPRDAVERGMNANIGGYLKKEIFCFFRNGFGEWEFGIYEP